VWICHQLGFSSFFGEGIGIRKRKSGWVHWQPGSMEHYKTKLTVKGNLPQIPPT